MDKVNAKTKLVGIIGWPVDHSASPKLHNTAIVQEGINYVFVALPVKPENLKDAVIGLRALGFVGVTVTMPYKTAIIPFLDVLDESVKLVGAANNIVVKDDKIVGYNTDMIGFIKCLKRQDVSIGGKNVVIFGAGGAARAVTAAAYKENAASFTVLGRNEEKVADFVKSYSFLENFKMAGCKWDGSEAKEAIASADIIVNATSLGMDKNMGLTPPISWENAKKGAVAVDLAYNPKATQFLLDAQKAGFKIINGEGMLIEQVGEIFNLFTGIYPSLDVMYDII